MKTPYQISVSHIFLSVGQIGSSTDLIDQRVEYLNEYNKRNKLIELLQTHEFIKSMKGKVLACAVLKLPSR